MREQIDFSNTEQFQQFMAGLPSLEKAAAIVHGVIIDLHPVWKWSVDYFRTTGAAPWWRHYPWPTLPLDVPQGPYDPVLDPPNPANDSWIDFVQLHDKKMREPFVVRVWVLPTTANTIALRRQVENYARQAPFFVTVEARPMASLAMNVEGSNDITATGPGSLGGFLKDQYGKKWGITCGHVAQTAYPPTTSPVTLEDVAGVRHVGAGVVGHTSFPPPASSQAGVCNQYVTNSHPEVDAALIELGSGFVGLDSIVKLGSVDEVYDRNQLQAGTKVWMTGPRSGMHEYVIGGYGVTAKVKFQTPTGPALYCFSHLFTFDHPGNSPNWMPGRVAQAVAPRPLQGDSGSWVLYKKQPNFAYFGNLIAVEGPTGIATFADGLIAWAKTNCSLDLGPL